MKKIFVADDRNTNFKSLKLAFDEVMPGCQLAHAINGEEIIAMVNEEKPDLVLMDIVMPIMDGLAATAELRKKYSKTELPIIAMTAQEQAAAEQRVMDAGCNEYLAKPYTLKDLMDKVGRYLPVAG